jgi:predicted acetyltransferase
MMRRQLTELHEQEKEPFAALWASEPTIYRRYGYGLATRRIGMTIETKLPYVAGAPEPGPLRMLPAEGVRDAVAAIYERARATRPGLLSRFPQRWDGLLDDTEATREGASSLTCALLDDGDGYVLYRTKGSWDDWLPNGKVIVRELVALNPSAHASLWRFLLDIDLMTTVEAWNRPLDEPLQHLVADTRRLHSTLGDAVWVRIVNVERALELRTYPVADSLVIEVVDPVCPWNTGRFALDVSAAHAPAAVRRTDSSADLTLSAVELGAIYLGGTRLRDLAAAGFVDEHSPGALARADRVFGGVVEPWCAEIF